MLHIIGHCKHLQGNGLSTSNFVGDLFNRIWATVVLHQNLKVYLGCTPSFVGACVFHQISRLSRTAQEKLLHCTRMYFLSWID